MAPLSDLLLILFLLLLALVSGGAVLWGFVAVVGGLAARKYWVAAVGVVFVTLGGVVLAGLGSLFWTLLSATDERPLAERARALVTLPSEAVVLSVQEGHWAGDGEATFRLPDDRLPAEWFDEIWESTSPGFPANMTNTDDHREGRQSEDHRTLRYDSESGVYTYNVVRGI